MAIETISSLQSNDYGFSEEIMAIVRHTIYIIQRVASRSESYVFESEPIYLQVPAASKQKRSSKVSNIEHDHLEHVDYSGVCKNIIIRYTNIYIFLIFTFIELFGLLHCP